MADKSSDNSGPVEVRRTEDGRFVHYGVVLDGAFHSFGSERAPDYDARVLAAAEEEGE